MKFSKWLFPRLPEDQRRHQLHLLLASLAVGLIISGIIVCIMLLTDQMTKYWLARL
jgi:hypothetical protein